MNNYHINLFYSKEDAGWIADIPDLEHCSAFGETPEAALHEALIANQVWLEAARAEGKAIPAPTYRPVIYQLSQQP
jgi:predicted RNase H-like HicB family nuclease